MVGYEIAAYRVKCPDCDFRLIIPALSVEGGVVTSPQRISVIHDSPKHRVETQDEMVTIPAEDLL